MGWVTFNCRVSAKDYFTNKFNSEPNYELVDISIVKFNTAFLAIRDKETGVIFCMVYLLHRAPKSYENFGYKDMSEFAGPYVTGCPKRILDKLTSVDEMIAKGFIDDDSCATWAREFRERQLNYINRVFKTGMVIKTHSPIKITSGHSFEYFKKVGRKIYGIGNYGVDREYEVRINFNVKKFDFDVISK